MPNDTAPQAYDGKIHTITGPIPPEQLGITLTHQHVLFYHSPEYNLQDVKEAESGLQAFRRAGGQTLAELSCAGLRLKNDLGPLYTLAVATGVNIIASVGYYKHQWCIDRKILDPLNPNPWREEQICEQMLTELVGTGICTLDSDPLRTIWGGIIGELGLTESKPIGCGYPVNYTFEGRNLRAAAMAHARTGAPIILHFDGVREPAYTRQVLDLLITMHGVRPCRIAVSHRDAQPQFFEDDLVLAKEYGVYLEYDWFILLEEQGALDLAVAANHFVRLIEKGCGHRLLVSPDILNHEQLVRFGYEYTLVILKAMKTHGLSQTDIDGILVRNPAAFLAWSR